MLHFAKCVLRAIFFCISVASHNRDDCISRIEIFAVLRYDCARIKLLMELMVQALSAQIHERCLITGDSCCLFSLCIHRIEYLLETQNCAVSFNIKPVVLLRE